MSDCDLVYWCFVFADWMILLLWWKKHAKACIL